MFPWTFYAFTETPKSPRYFGWHAIAQQVVNHCAVPWNSREMSVAISYVGIRCDTYDRIRVSFLKSCRRREDFHIITAPLLLLRYRWSAVTSHEFKYFERRECVTVVDAPALYVDTFFTTYVTTYTAWVTNVFAYTCDIHKCL